MAASCDVTFAMLADPESAVGITFVVVAVSSYQFYSIKFCFSPGRCCLWKEWSCKWYGTWEGVNFGDSLMICITLYFSWDLFTRNAFYRIFSNRLHSDYVISSDKNYASLSLIFKKFIIYL